MFYTMNVKDEGVLARGYDHHFSLTRSALENHFGPCELLLSTDTLQFGDYSRYESERFDVDGKLKRHAEVFPVDCIRAFELGARMASAAL